MTLKFGTPAVKKDDSVKIEAIAEEPDSSPEVTPSRGGGKYNSRSRSLGTKNSSDSNKDAQPLEADFQRNYYRRNKAFIQKALGVLLAFFLIIGIGDAFVAPLKTNTAIASVISAGAAVLLLANHFVIIKYVPMSGNPFFYSFYLCLFMTCIKLCVTRRWKEYPSRAQVALTVTFFFIFSSSLTRGVVWAVSNTRLLLDGPIVLLTQIIIFMLISPIQFGYWVVPGIIFLY